LICDEARLSTAVIPKGWSKPAGLLGIAAAIPHLFGMTFGNRPEARALVKLVLISKRRTTLPFLSVSLHVLACLVLILGRPLFAVAGPITASVNQRTGALTGRIVFTSAGHGWTYGNGDGPGRWYTQRGVTQEMNEDYGNLDQMTLFAFHCFNAGATVVPLRPVGFQTNEVVLDNDSPGVVFAGNWSDSSATIFYGATGDVPYRFASIAPTETATATYTPTIRATGFYPVYTWVAHGGNRTSQLYRINHTGGQAAVRVPHHMVGQGWVYLGTYYFNAGSNSVIGAVIVSNLHPTPAFGSVVIADAIRFGNGMGDIIPSPKTNEVTTVSGYPREEEAARYWIAAGLGRGQSASLYDTSGDDESDNVGAPIRMAVEMNRETAESLYKRVYVGFHSNAGGGRGTLGLYNNPSLFPGTATPNQFRLAQLIGKEVNDNLSLMASPPLEVPWHNRGSDVTYARSDFAFGEINNGSINNEFDATILEVAFHDSADDSKLLRDPKVRNAVARFTCQAIVRYMNQFDGLPLNFVPEPPQNVAAVGDANGAIVLSWNVPAAGQQPTGYIVYRSSDGFGFGNPVTVSGGTATSVSLAGLVPDTDFYFRITAINAGGESMPSETVGCRQASVAGKPRVLIVNGFDRFDRMLDPRQTPAVRNYVPPGPNGTIDRVMSRLVNSFDYVVPHGKAVSASGVAFDSCQNESIAANTIRLTNYAAVIWALGNESSADETFSSTEQSRVAAYLDRGGPMFVSGSEVGWDLDRSIGPTAADRAFLNAYLHADLGGDTNDDAETFSFSAAPDSIFAGNAAAQFDDGTRGIYYVEYPDVLSPRGSGAVAALNYSGGIGGPAGIQYDGTAGGGKVVLFGFPFETITSASGRNVYMSDVLRFFGVLDAPRFLSVAVPTGDMTATLTWSALPGKKYQLQFKADADGATWQNIGTPVTATTNMLSRTDIGTAGVAQRFYRVALVD
jgi:hypothetical protein